ncbi:MAG: glycosyltransferase family 39 protein [Candidatus Omnitrophica bacterium]|nr:glycosyltransferase family 39 protein [Candidatus Omnitrophota bacterium]MDD5352765.1 glycosyltransferase family 39 protein [Candidatus Omnitrophota bacterium]MDD5550364.1 glycosyltransferase family 39 protein [Candidatus Omnitrophota bacterium]
MTKLRQDTKHVFILLILSYFFFIFGNGIMSLTNPDEVFYTQIAKEMVKHSSWLTPYLFDAPNFEKPIFLYWLLRIGFILFGVSSFSARIFPAVFAALGVLAVYYLGLCGFKDSRKAFYSALVLLSSGLYIGLARTVFTDMVFSVWILLSLLSFLWGYLRRERKGVSLILFSVFSALAVLTKGPLGFIIPFLIIVLFLWFRHEVMYLWCVYAIWGALVFTVIALPWYAYMFTKYKNAFTHEFFYNDHIRRLITAEHKTNDTWYFYPFSMIAGVFPWSIFVLVSLYTFVKRRLRQREPVCIFLACWIAVVFVVFQSAHSKLASYIFPLLPALALLTGDYIVNIAEGKNNLFTTSLFILVWCALLLLPVALFFGPILYPGYISAKIPLYSFGLIISCLLLAMLRFILRREFFKTVILLALILPIMLLMVPFIKNDIEPYFSSNATGEYLVKNTDANSVILCSKPFVRGVRYYADRKVALISNPGSNFFSPHPIPFLDSDEKVKDFLRNQSVTYCALRKSSVKDIERITKQGFDFTILKTIGNEYILRIQPAKK